MLKRYCGHDARQRPNTKRRWYGDSPELYSRYVSSTAEEGIDARHITDDSWSYQFNSLGYRGEEFNAFSREVIFLCGCSHTFGLGIKWEQTFGYVFRDLYCQSRNLKRSDVNLQNFSSVGASNDYIARTLATQMSCFTPNLVIVYFTSRTRKEYVKGRRLFSLQPSLLSDSFPTTSGAKGKALIEASYDYYAFYTDEMAFVDTMKNIVLIKSLCERLGTRYLFAWHDFSDLKKTKFTRNPVCNSFIKMIEPEKLCDFTLRSMEVDRARDGIHSGPRTNELFAEALFRFFLQDQERAAYGIPN